MTHSLDTETLTLLEEHVRQLFQVMGFAQITVHCRQPHAQVAAKVPEEAWLQDAALNTYQPPREQRRPREQHEELLIAITAGDEGKLLIGMQGVHLEALQHIIRTILRRQFKDPIHVLVDVNGYRARREETLTHLAESAARRAKSSGKTITLEPMTAADRRAVHSALASRPDVRTESTGDEPHRRVVIRPVL